MGVEDRFGNDVREEPRPGCPYRMARQSTDVGKGIEQVFFRVLFGAGEVEGQRLFVIKRIRHLVC